MLIDLPFVFVFIGVMFLIGGPLALIPLLTDAADRHLQLDHAETVEAHYRPHHGREQPETRDAR